MVLIVYKLEQLSIWQIEWIILRLKHVYSVYISSYFMFWSFSDSQIKANLQQEHNKYSWNTQNDQENKCVWPENATIKKQPTALWKRNTEYWHPHVKP